MPFLIKHIFCNTNLTEKKSKLHNKAENGMTKAEKRRWLSRNRYR